MVLTDDFELPVIMASEVQSVIHDHCQTCIKIAKCAARPIRPGFCCEIVQCEVECGARFHACKASEHKLLCRNERVPCINAVYGCPFQIFRHQRGPHLQTCPASVIHCTMEWNRWPVCSRERQQRIPFNQPNPHARAGQLDIALALRDQRMLNDWLRAPRRTRRALRNSLTRRFPAVPVQPRFSPDSEVISQHTSQSCTDDEDDTPWEVRKTPPGLQRSVCGELYRASKQTTDCLSIALSMITRNDNRRDDAARIIRNASLEEDKENITDLANVGLPCTEDHLPPNLGIEYMEVEDAVDDGGKNTDDIVQYDILFFDNTVVSDISSASMADHAKKQPSSPPPPPSPPLLVNLGLDLNLESITRYQTKPKSMYTFLCAQEFRRDEYSWHYKNVHSDIHGGLNGWLEQRCPLAHYGCMYSIRRFFPTHHGYTIVHNDTLESFGIQPPESIPEIFNRSSQERRPLSSRKSPGRNELPNGLIESMASIPEDGSEPQWNEIPSSLCQLPFELLQHIAGFLDSFSISNLAMTSRLLREVSCSILERRGIVVQQWERQQAGNSFTWVVAYKRWFFSSAFTPVKQWVFADNEHMANHLGICAYFQRNVQTEPYTYEYPPMKISPEMYEKIASKPLCTGS